MSRLDAVEQLVRTPSVSESEGALADVVEHELRSIQHLDVTRVGDNVVATTKGAVTGVLLAAHLDTVPGDVSLVRREGDTLYGLGSCDTKGSVAGLLELARTPWAVGVTYVFYAREEIARARSGLLEVKEVRPDLLETPLAVVAEPTLGAVEAGCQGSLRARLTLRGQRAHTSRPFTGRNAIHRLAPLLRDFSDYQPREVHLEGVTYVEQLQVVKVVGGVANNVVPDEATLVVNFRFAPDRTSQEAEAWFRERVEPMLDQGDDVSIEDLAPAAPPSLVHADLARLVELTGRPARAKVGWTDVATFAAWNIPAVNFGAGDPLLAHSAAECLRESEVNEFVETLTMWLAEGFSSGEVPK